jgi:hypothetical protein
VAGCHRGGDSFIKCAAALPLSVPPSSSSSSSSSAFFFFPQRDIDRCESHILSRSLFLGFLATF